MNAPERVADRPQKARDDPSHKAKNPWPASSEQAHRFTLHPDRRMTSGNRPQFAGLGGPSGRSQSMSVNFPPETSADFCRIRLAGLRVEKR